MPVIFVNIDVRYNLLHMKALQKPQILVILGPTASGKSDLAVQIAKKYKGEIISADSRQVYKGLNIGTGKIRKYEMRGIPHYLLDVASPKKRFSVSDYKKLGEIAIDKILKKNKLPIIVGGTGLYVAALLGEMDFPEVPPNLELRVKLEGKSTPELFKILNNLDPRRAREIDKNNPRRLIRAIEIAETLGKIPRLKNRNKKRLKYNALKIGIKIKKEKLQNKINKRIKKWFKQGLIKEVESLHKRGLSWKRLDEIGLEYRIVSKYLKKEISKEEMINRMEIETCQYAKRQITWFKKDKNILWLEPDFIISTLKKSIIFKEVPK